MVIITLRDADKLWWLTTSRTCRREEGAGRKGVCGGGNGKGSRVKRQRVG